MSIFTADELAADQVGANDTPAPADEQDQAGQQPARDEQGRFAPKPGEPQEAPAGEAEPGTADKPGQVPQGALHAERERRKASDAKAAEYKAQLDAIAQMRAQVANRQPEQPADAPAADDPAQVAYLRQRLEQLEGTQQQFQQRQQMESVEQVERQHLGAALSASESEFRQTKPDYDAAVAHVVNARAQELRLYGLNDVEVQQTLQQEVLDITRAAIQQQRSPAEVAYELAQLRGYRAEAGQAGQQGQGAAAAQVAGVAAARASSRSLGQAAGAAPAQDLNAQTVAAMTDEEFAALYSTPEGRRMIDAL